MNPTYDEIVKANALRGNVIRKTPLIHSPTFSDLTNSQIYLKEEFRQKTGSFKIRAKKEEKTFLQFIVEICL